MKIGRRLLLGLIAASTLGAYQASRVIADPNLFAFERFIADTRPLCLYGQAAACVGSAWRFADGNGDRGLSVEELQVVRDDLEAWALWRSEDLAAHERSGIALGLWMVDSLGLENLHAAYDADGDGRISRDELLADVRLDERPIGEVLLDPNAVDHGAIARRLGLPPALLDRLPLEQAE